MNPVVYVVFVEVVTRMSKRMVRAFNCSAKDLRVAVNVLFDSLLKNKGALFPLSFQHNSSCIVKV